MTKEALIIFAKNPEAGNVKTRLAATIGDEEALSVYKQLLLHTRAVTEHLAFDKYVFYSNWVEQEDVWNNTHYNKEVQFGSDLGERMKNAFDTIIQRGYDKAVIIGTDCPALNEKIIQDAFDKLGDVDVVIGPALDGGYYLLGLKNNHFFLFENIQWSTPDVLPATINKCKSAGLLFFLLEPLQDIDEEKDLKQFRILMD